MKWKRRKKKLVYQSDDLSDFRDKVLEIMSEGKGYVKLSRFTAEEGSRYFMDISLSDISDGDIETYLLDEFGGGVYTARLYQNGTDRLHDTFLGSFRFKIAGESKVNKPSQIEKAMTTTTLELLTTSIKELSANNFDKVLQIVDHLKKDNGSQSMNEKMFTLFSNIMLNSGAKNDTLEEALRVLEFSKSLQPQIHEDTTSSILALAAPILQSLFLKNPQQAQLSQVSLPQPQAQVQPLASVSEQTQVQNTPVKEVTEIITGDEIPVELHVMFDKFDQAISDKKPIDYLAGLLIGMVQWSMFWMPDNPFPCLEKMVGGMNKMDYSLMSDGFDDFSSYMELEKSLADQIRDKLIEVLKAYSKMKEADQNVEGG